MDTPSTGTSHTNGASSEELRISHHFTGAVQSRGFRYACVKASGKAHVTGWVQNQPDGTVRAETQGNQRQQDAFIKRLSALMPGFGTEWHDDTETIDCVDDEQVFCVHK